MKRHSTATLMNLTKRELVEYVRMAEHNQEVAEAALDQQAKNLKGWEPINPELREAVRLLHGEYEKAKKLGFVLDPLAYALHRTWRAVDERPRRGRPKRGEKDRGK